MPPFNYTIIIVLSKHRLDLSALRKSPNLRIFVVGPPRLLYDETNVDVYYQVEPPIKEAEHCQLFQKVRELCSVYASTQRRLVTFEKRLQLAIAKIRFEMDIEGFTPDQLDQLMRIRDTSSVTRRGGLTTVRHCSLTGQPQPEQWVEVAKSHLGRFPVIIKPSKSLGNCPHSMSIARNEDELKMWIRTRLSRGRPDEEYLIEECLEDGHEFTAICTTKSGLIGCIVTVETHRSIYECIGDQRPYALEYYNTDQTRDLLPGVESFVMQAIKTIFVKSSVGVMFIKGFYKGHNEIYFMGVSLEPDWDSFRALITFPRKAKNWEVLHVESLIDGDEGKDTLDPPSTSYHSMLNFPTQEGVLIHQTTIAKRRTSEMRVCWRTAEGQELKDAEGPDDNVLQVFMSNPDRSKLLAEAGDILQNTDITIDRNPIEQKNLICRRNLARLSGQKELIRSCTTTD
ncbi:unnamed protein product, partial [Mesorhabditis belari]|uniref:ATP-grasp domain-containing protein n=1 Tax=Mesorhabditis belari TaxID=2138241 RepID=A0AAF3FQ67_9BILA